MKQRMRLCFLAILLLPSFLSKGQSTDVFFGMNYWEYADWGSGLTDEFQKHIPETQTWNFGIVRIGGNHSNVEPHAQVKEWYDQPISNIIGMGATPLVQFPINLSPSQVSVWMDYFNVTKGYNIVYWAIGNEPDPSSNYDQWFAGSIENEANNTYTEFRGKFRAIATEIKKKDPNSIVVGPDFRHWWGSADGNSGPFGKWYKDFLYGGNNPVGTDDYNGDQLVDIFAFHFYGDGGDGDFDEGDFIQKHAELTKLINATNAARPSNQPIKIAVGEYNDNNPTGFLAGQRMVIMAKQALEKGAVFMTPWSISEGYHWAMIDKSNGKWYSTAHHWKMLCQNKQDNFMLGQINDNHSYDIVQFGMQGSDGYTVVLVNEGNSDYSFSVKFSTASGDYSAANTGLKFRFNANENVDFSDEILYKNSTILYTFDNAGNRVKKIEYKDGDTTPTTTFYNTPVIDPVVSFTNIADGATFEEGVSLTPNVSASHSSGIANVQLYLNGALVRQENISPYDWGGNDAPITNMAAGAYELRALATATNGQTGEAIINITIENPAEDAVVSFTNIADGATFEEGVSLTPNVDASHSSGIANVQLYLNGTLVRQENISPYDWGGNDAPITNMAAGAYELRALATATNGETGEAIINITINGLTDPLMLTYFHFVNKLTGDYMRPLGGSATANIVMYDLAAEPVVDSYQWEFVSSPLNADNYYILNKWTDQAILPAGASINPATAITQMDPTSNWNALQWVVEESDETGFYWIKNVKSGLYIRPQGGQESDGQGTVQVVQDALITSYSSFKWSLLPKDAKAAARTASSKLKKEMEEDLSSEIFKIYPNPAVNTVNLTIETNWEIVDMTGSHLLSGKGSFINVSGLANGIYLIKANGGSQRLVIQK